MIPIDDRAGRGREATVGDIMTEDTELSRDRARIESTLDWYFNFGEGDVGLESNHGAAVAVLVNRKERSLSNPDAAEEAMFQAVEAVLHVGASVAVPLVVFREAFPEVWASIKAVSELRCGVCAMCGGSVDP